MRLAEIDTLIGRLRLLATDRGLREVLWAGDPMPAGTKRDADPALEAAARQLQEYFDGSRRAFDLPLDLDGTAFQRSAWLALQTIPFGTTVSYGEQARRLGHPGAARAVGAANGRNPLPIVLPCHRLVGARGELTGYGGGIDVKEALLEHERRVLAGGG
jgi:methylated-DNA-[protein]-cysteine S-methyltransferase